MSRRFTPELFWSYVTKIDGCWLWNGAVDSSGYGHMTKLNVLEKAHRIAWEVTNGTIPNGVQVLHRCDVRRCCNPNHLFLGNDADNHKDAAQKGRHDRRLTIPQVKEIREIYSRGGMLQTEIGDLFGVTGATVSRIVNFVRRPHV